MNCRRAKKLVFNFLDGMINDQDRLALESHLGECSKCEAMAASLTKSLDLLHRLPPAELDENFNWKVRLRLAREKNAAARPVDTHSWARSWNRRFAFSALSTFVVAIAIGYVVMNASVMPTDFVPGRIVTAEDEPKANRERQQQRVKTPGETIAKPGKQTSPVIPVAVGVEPLDQSAVEGPLKEDRPTFDLDSLRVEFLKSAAVNYRVRQLQHQVEMLQIQLRECEFDNK